MNPISRLHEALFDELERQGALTVGVDVGGLTRAVASRFHLAEIDPLGLLQAPGRRCVNGACDE